MSSQGDSPWTDISRTFVPQDSAAQPLQGPSSICPPICQHGEAPPLPPPSTLGSVTPSEVRDPQTPTQEGVAGSSGDDTTSTSPDDTHCSGIHLPADDDISTAASTSEQPIQQTQRDDIEVAVADGEGHGNAEGPPSPHQGRLHCSCRRSRTAEERKSDRLFQLCLGSWLGVLAIVGALGIALFEKAWDLDEFQQKQENIQEKQEWIEKDLKEVKTLIATVTTTTTTTTSTTTSANDPLASILEGMQSQIDELKKNVSESKAKEEQLQVQVAQLQKTVTRLQNSTGQAGHSSGKSKSKLEYEQNNGLLANVSAALESCQTMTMILQEQFDAVSKEVREEVRQVSDDVKKDRAKFATSESVHSQGVSIMALVEATKQTNEMQFCSIEEKINATQKSVDDLETQNAATQQANEMQFSSIIADVAFNRAQLATKMAEEVFNKTQQANEMQFSSIIADVATKAGSHDTQKSINDLGSKVSALQSIMQSFNGTILEWSGSVETIPEHFVLCDGTNGTPDLRDKFVLGCSSSSTCGVSAGGFHKATSRSGSHNHGGNCSAHSLSLEEIPWHSHEYSELPRYVVSSWRGGGLEEGEGSPNYHWIWSQTRGAGGNKAHSHDIDEDGDHQHFIDVTPPYYSMAFIMHKPPV